jgi:hypothetical protein
MKKKEVEKKANNAFIMYNYLYSCPFTNPIFLSLQEGFKSIGDMD